MSKLFFTLVILFIFQISTNAQSQEDSIRIERVFGGYKFFQGDSRLMPNDLLLVMEQEAMAHKHMKSAKNNWMLSGIIGGVGGFLIGYPLGTAIAGGEPEWAMAGVGAALVVVTIPITISANKKAQKAVELYNSGLISSVRPVHFNVGLTGNGLALKVTF